MGCDFFHISWPYLDSWAVSVASMGAPFLSIRALLVLKPLGKALAMSMLALLVLKSLGKALAMSMPVLLMLKR